jgi:hypothetical protein
MYHAYRAGETAALVQPARARQRRDRTAASGGTGTDSAAVEISPTANDGREIEISQAEDAARDAVSIIPVGQVLAPLLLVEPERADSIEV